MSTRWLFLGFSTVQSGDTDRRFGGSNMHVHVFICLLSSGGVIFHVDGVR